MGLMGLMLKKDHKGTDKLKILSLGLGEHAAEMKSLR